MRITHASLAVGALGLIALAIVGCGGDDATPTPEPAALVVDATAAEGGGWAYDPSELTIPSEGSSTISLVNTDIVEHDLTSDELDESAALFEREKKP